MPNKRKTTSTTKNNRVGRRGSSGTMTPRLPHEFLPAAVGAMQELSLLSARYPPAVTQPLVVLNNLISMCEDFADYGLMSYVSVCRAMSLTAAIEYHYELAAIDVRDGKIEPDAAPQAACDALMEIIGEYRFEGSFGDRPLIAIARITPDQIGWQSLMLLLDDRLALIWALQSGEVRLVSRIPLEDPSWTDEEHLVLKGTRDSDMPIPDTMAEAISLGDRFVNDLVTRYDWVSGQGMTKSIGG